MFYLFLWNIFFGVFLDFNSLGCHSAEDINLEWNVIFDKSNFSISDGYNGSFFDEFRGFSLEESIGWGSLVGDYGSNESGKTIVRLDLFYLDDFNINVIAISGINEGANLDELRFSEFRHKVEN